MKKKLIASAVIALGLAASGSASAIIVGGVDFGNLTPGAHLETTTLAETFVNAPGQTLQGYGQVNTVNGNLLYGQNPVNRLYFTFEYEVLTFSATDATFGNGTVNVYLMPTINLLAQSSAANLGLIALGTPWATLTGHDINGGPSELNATGILTGSGLAFTGAGILDVTGGQAAVVSYLDTNTLFDGAGGFADIEITTSGSSTNLNPNDNTVGCTTGQATPGQWCLAGSADMRGATAVPEPGTLALMGLGLMGLGASYRRKMKKA